MVNPKRKSRRARRIAGASLITAVALTAATVMLSSGLAVLGMSYWTRMNVDRSADQALVNAESGANWMINYASRWVGEKTFSLNKSLYTKSNPYVGSVAGMPGTYSVYLDVPSGTTTIPSTVSVVSTGTVNGVSRTVNVTAAGRSIMGDYAMVITHRIYLKDTKYNWMGKVAASGLVEGNKATINNSDIYLFNGKINGGTWDNPGSVYSYDQDINVPTTTDLAKKFGATTDAKDFRTTTGATASKNLEVRVFDTSKSPADPYDLSAWPVYSYTKNKNTYGGILGLNYAGGGSGGNAATWHIDDKTWDEVPVVNQDGHPLKGKKVILLTAADSKGADYFFDMINTSLSKSPNTVMVIDNRYGPVRIWMQHSDSSGDELAFQIVTTVPENGEGYPARFLYNKESTLIFTNPTPPTNLGIWAVRPSSNNLNKLATVKFDTTGWLEGKGFQGSIVANILYMDKSMTLTNNHKDGYLAPMDEWSASGDPDSRFYFNGTYRRS